MHKNNKKERIERITKETRNFKGIVTFSLIFNFQITPLEPSFLSPTLVRKIRVPKRGREVFIPSLITAVVKQKKFQKDPSVSGPGGLDRARAGEFMSPDGVG